MEEKILIEIVNNYGITPDVIESIKGLIIDFKDAIEQVCNNLNQIVEGIYEEIRSLSNKENDEKIRNKPYELEEFINNVSVTNIIIKKFKEPP